jgi:hypothetical protein
MIKNCTTCKRLNADCPIPDVIDFDPPCLHWQRGAVVSRSVYQKLAEENKRLLRDLKTICTGDIFESITLRIHYREKFKKEEKFWNDIRAILKKEANSAYKTAVKNDSNINKN